MKKKQLLLKSLLLVLLAIWLPSLINAQTIRYVKADGITPAANAANATSWSAACNDLQAVINASSSDDQVWVAAGTYKPNRGADKLETITLNNRDNAFVMKKNVKLYGGFAGGETSVDVRQFEKDATYGLSVLTNQTILSGDIGTAGDNSDNCYHVVVSAGDMGNACLDGFTIIKGNADADFSDFIEVNYRLIFRSRGGGFHASMSYVNINNCLFKENEASAQGALYTSSGKTVITNTMFIGNKAIKENAGALETRTSATTLKNVIAARNEAEKGGTIIMYQNESSKFINVLVCDNKAKGSSEKKNAGILIDDTELMLINVTVANNTLTNVVGRGAGIFNLYGSKVTINNSIIWGNKAKDNTISNVDGINISCNKSIYNEVVHSNPGFIDPANGNYRLQNASPAINTGDSTLYSTPLMAANDGFFYGWDNEVDLDGNLRLLGNVIDLGAYESEVSPTANDVIFTPATAIYDGTEKPVTVDPAPGVTGLGTITVKYNGSTTVPVNVGTYPITVAIAKGTHYKATTSDLNLGNLEITKASPTANELTFTPASAIYDNTEKPVTVDPAPGVTGLGTITVKYNGSTTVPVNAGTYPITVTIAGGANYKATTSDLNLGNFEITKAGPTANELTFTPASAIYDNTEKPVTVSPAQGVKGLGTITVKYNGSTTVPVNAGTYPITVTIVEGANYKATSSDLNLGNFTVSPTSITVTADEGQNKVYGTADPEFTYQLTSGQLYDNANFTGLLSREAGNDVGVYPITQGALLVNDGNNGNNYTINFISKLFVITAALGEIIVDAVSEKTYGDADFTLSATHEGGNPVKFESITPDIVQIYEEGGLFKANIRNAGSAIIRVYTEAAGNYLASETYLIVPIKKAAPLTPSSLPEDLEATYGDRFQNVSLPTGFRWPNTNTKVGNASPNPVYVTVIYNPNLQNYEDYTAYISLTIHKAEPRKVVFPEAGITSLIYDPNQLLDNIALLNGSGSGSFAWRNPDIVPTVDKTGYEVVFTPYDTDNYDYSDVSGWNSRTGTIIRTVSLTVIPQEIEVSLTAGEIVTYTGLPVHISPASVTVISLRNSLSYIPDIEYLYYLNGIPEESAINVGEYEVTARSADANYKGESTPVSFTIEKAPIVIHANNMEAIYTGGPINMECEISGSHTASGLYRTLVFIYEGINGTVYGPAKDAPSEIGEYHVHISTTGSVNHLPAEAEAVLKIVNGTSINNTTAGRVSVYPNPVAKNSVVTLDIPAAMLADKDLQVEVYNTNGVLLRKIALTNTRTELQSEYVEGTYFYVIKSTTSMPQTVKIVVK